MGAGRATGCSKVAASSLQPNLISRTGRDHSKQPTTARSRPSHRELAPSQKVAGQTLLPRKSTVRESLDSLPASQRKMRSAPVFVKNDEPKTCAKRVAQPSKWSAEDLAKKIARTNTPSTVPAVVPAVRKLESQAPPAAPRQKVISPISNEPAPSRVPVSKRLQRQLGGRGLPAFRSAIALQRYTSNSPRLVITSLVLLLRKRVACWNRTVSIVSRRWTSIKSREQTSMIVNNWKTVCIYVQWFISRRSALHWLHFAHAHYFWIRREVYDRWHRHRQSSLLPMLSSSCVEAAERRRMHVSWHLGAWRTFNVGRPTVFRSSSRRLDNVSLEIAHGQRSAPYMKIESRSLTKRGPSRCRPLPLL